MEEKRETVAPKEIDPLARIAMYVKQMNWNRVKALAEEAVTSGQFTDEQIEQAVDAALPSPERAARLPINRLAAVAAIASPARKKEYAMALKNYPGLDAFPDHKAQIAEHMQLIGVEA